MSSATMVSPFVAAKTSAGRQLLVFHVGAGMQRLVERAGDDLGSDGAGTLGLPERTAEIHPVERQDEVGLTHQFARSWAESRWMAQCNGPGDRSGTSPPV